MEVRENLTTIDFRAILTQEPLEDPDFDLREAEYIANELKKHVRGQVARLSCPQWWTVDTFQSSRWPAMASAIRETIANPQCLLVTAPTNSGKSHALCAIARELAGTMSSPDDLYRTVYRVKEHELYPLWDTSRYHRSDRYDSVIEEAKAADVLVYDDLGKVEIARGEGFSLTPFGCVLFSIFDARAEARKINLVSSRYDDLGLLQGAVGVDLIRRVLQMEGDTARGAVIARRPS